MTVTLFGGPAPYREALAAQLVDRGFLLEPVGGQVTVVVCRTDTDWDQAADTALWAPTVVVLDDLNVELYSRALSIGAGVVHLDTSTAIMANVIEAAVAGEALIPLTVAQALAAHRPPTAEEVQRMPLVGVELQIADGLREGLSIGQIAESLCYSDRTIRRKLQGIYLKLGVPDKHAAVEALRR